MTSVLIADDQDLVREGLRTLLSRDPDLEVCAEAHHGSDALQKVREHRPDVVLMDLRMPVVDGIAATHEIRRDPELCQCKVLVLTTFNDEQEILQALRAGAAGYLLKDTRSEELRAGVKAVARGDTVLSPQITRQVVQHISAAPPEPETEQVDLSLLTEREVEVLTRLAHGDTNAEIAERLYLSPATARTYVSRILAKLQARDRTELAIIGHRAGLYVGGD